MYCRETEMTYLARRASKATEDVARLPSVTVDNAVFDLYADILNVLWFFKCDVLGPEDLRSHMGCCKTSRCCSMNRCCGR